MRPALSLIIFTSLSGLGFGIVIAMGLSGALSWGLSWGLPGLRKLGFPAAPGSGWWLLQHGLALGLIGGGILASTFHLGHPERAWRALSQWRTSWLSREGVLAAITCFIVILWFLDGFYYQTNRPWIGVLAAALALATIGATAMIYASLKTVARWHHPLTLYVFIAYALAGGGLVATTFARLAHSSNTGHFALAAGILIIVSTAIAYLHTHLAGAQGSGSSPESATGIGTSGQAPQEQAQEEHVRMLMPPHSEENWLQHEMGFQVARKHATTIRLIGYGLSAVIPLIILWLAPTSAPLLVLASLSHISGVMFQRWLFFAEAKHTVTLYYGARH